MEHVERFAQEFAIDDERNICFRSALSAGDDADTTTSECSEQFTGDTRCLLHVLTHDGDGSQTALHQHGEHSSRLNFLSELGIEHLGGCCGILVAHTDRGGVLR